MGTLLKDMPQHAERIENNYLLGATIKDHLDDIEINIELDQEFENSCIEKIIDELRDAQFEIIDNKVVIDDKQGLAISIFGAFKKVIYDNEFTAGDGFEIKNKGSKAESIRDSISEFVNDNYIWKGETAQ